MEPSHIILEVELKAARVVGVLLLVLFLVAMSTSSGTVAPETITSYSTVTSTVYSERLVATTSTLFLRSTITASRQVQAEMDGPYVRVKGTSNYRYDISNYRVDTVSTEAAITNLMTVPIEKGRIFITVTNKAQTVREEIFVLFQEIKVGETITVKQGVPLTKTFYYEDIKFFFELVEINFRGALTTTVQTAAATYTYLATRTETHLTSYTTAYYITSEPQTFLNLNTLALVLSAFAITAIVAVALASRKRQTDATTGLKPCAKCGFQLPSDATYCSECGEKQAD